MSIVDLPTSSTEASSVDDLLVWLDGVADRVADLASKQLTRLIVDRWVAFAETLTAAGDPAAWDGFSTEWERFVTGDLGDLIGGAYLGGGVAAWMSAPTTKAVPVEVARAFAAAVNTAAVDYMQQATNRIVGAGEAVWRQVQTRAADAIRAGASTEDLKRMVEDVTGYCEYRADAIARTETVGAFVGGDWEGAVALGDLGPIEKVWWATTDVRTRDSHAQAHGQVRKMNEPFQVGATTMMRPHDPAGGPGEVVHCRCVVLFLYPGDQRPDGSIVPEPEGWTKPGEASWSPEPFTGNLSPLPQQPALGGAHAKTVLVDEHGTRWLHKPMEPWLAHAEAAASEIARRAGLDVPRVYIHTVNGQVGSLQRMIDGARPGFPVQQHAFDPTRVARADLHEIQRHRVLDWVIGNHDGHAAQYVRAGYASDGARIVGIDKGQAWRWWGEGERLDWRFHPNARYGEAAPAANLIEQAFAEGRLRHDDLPFVWRKHSPTRQTAEAIAAIPDVEYRAILRPYAVGRWAGDPDIVERFLDDMVARKNSVVADFTRLHRRLAAAERKTRPKPQPALSPTGDGPKGMAGAVASEADDKFMTRTDHPVNRSSPHAQAVRDYTGSAYADINSALRSGQTHALVADIDAALRPVREDMIVTRATRMADRLPGGDPRSVQGGAILDRAYLSTSAGVDRGPAFDGDIGLIIRVNTGDKGAWVRPVSKFYNEREFLLGRDQTLYVHVVRRADRTRHAWEGNFQWIMEVEIVDDAWLAKQNLKVWDLSAKAYVDPRPGKGP